MQRWLWLSGAALGAILCATWLWTRTPLARSLGQHTRKLHEDNTALAASPASENEAQRSTAPAIGVMHRDPEKRALLRRKLLQLRIEPSHESVRRALGAASAAPRPTRPADDPKLYSAFINQHIRPDLSHPAQTCYEELLERSPSAHGDVTLGLEFWADRDLGGVVNAVVLRDTTLSDERFHACLRDSFSSLYFDPPPSGGRAAANFRFHFEHGNVATGEQVSLIDKHGNRDGSGAASTAKP